MRAPAAGRRCSAGAGEDVDQASAVVSSWCSSRRRWLRAICRSLRLMLAAASSLQSPPAGRPRSGQTGCRRHGAVAPREALVIG